MKWFILFLLSILYVLLLTGCDIPPGSKCIDGYVYHQATKDVWVMVNGGGVGIPCRPAPPTK